MNVLPRVALTLIGAVFVGATATFACVSIDRSIEVFENLREKATRTEAHTLALTGGNTLRVDVPAGDVRVRAVAGADHGELNAVVTARGTSVEDAHARLRQVKLVITTEADGPLVRVDPGDPASPSRTWATVDLSIDVPSGVKLQISSRSGDVAAQVGPFGPSTLESQYGDVVGENVAGDLRAETKSGDVAVNGSRGGDLEATSGYGSVRVAGIECGRATVHSGSGDVSFEHATCREAKIDSNYGNVTLADVRSDAALEAASGSGNVRATRLTAARASLTSSYGDVSVSEATGVLALKSGSGDVSAKAVRSDVRAETNYGSVALDGMFTSLTAASKSGDVDVVAGAGSSVAGAWCLSSSYGDVSLLAPRDIAFELDARTGYGSIDVGYAMEVQPGSLAKNSKSIRGRVNGGTVGVRLETSSGDVAVRPSGP